MLPMPEAADVPIKAGVFVDEDFVPGRARLRASRCSRCGEAFFPARRICPRCRVDGTLQNFACGLVGTIHSITRVARPPQHYAEPYWLAEIDLPDGVRLLAQVDAPPDRRPTTGTAVQMATRPLLILADGKRMWGYVFKLGAEAP